MDTFTGMTDQRPDPSDLHETQRAVHDEIVAAGFGERTAVRLRRNGSRQTGSMNCGPYNGGRLVAVVRFDRVRRNQWRTLSVRDLDDLEIKVSGRYVPFRPLQQKL